ncbi:MAG: hypothetical protein ACOH1X_11885 [Kaistella sp.]
MKIICSKKLVSASILGLLFLLFKIIFFNDKIENHPILSGFYNLLQNLILSFVAATIFYFIVQYLPQKKRNEKILENLEEFKKNCGYCINNIMNGMNKESFGDMFKYSEISEDFLKILMAKTSYSHITNYPYVGISNITLKEFIFIKEQELKENLNHMLQFQSYLTPEIIRIILNLKQIELYKNFVSTEAVIEIFEGKQSNIDLIFDTFLNIIRQLKMLDNEWIELKSQ